MKTKKGSILPNLKIQNQKERSYIHMKDKNLLNHENVFLSQYRLHENDEKYDEMHSQKSGLI